MLTPALSFKLCVMGLVFSLTTIEVRVHMHICILKVNGLLTTVRSFVSILCSGTPAAINQLVVTQLYNPAGSAESLSMYIALQCEFMPDFIEGS